MLLKKLLILKYKGTTDSLDCEHTEQYNVSSKLLCCCCNRSGRFERWK